MQVIIIPREKISKNQTTTVLKRMKYNQIIFSVQSVAYM
jgi:hypothetical protein